MKYARQWFALLTAATVLTSAAQATILSVSSVSTADTEIAIPVPVSLGSEAVTPLPEAAVPGTSGEISAEPLPEAPAEPELPGEIPAEPLPETPTEPQLPGETPAEPLPETPTEPELPGETPAEPLPETPTEPQLPGEIPAEPLPETPTEPQLPGETPAEPLPEIPTDPELPEEMPPLEEPVIPSVVLSHITSAEFNHIYITQNFFSDIRPFPDILDVISSIPAQVQRPDGTVETVRLTIDWTIPQTYPLDAAVPGPYPQTGVLVLPDDTYVLSEDVVSRFTLPVEVITNPFTVADFASPEAFPSLHVLEVNGDLTALLDTLPAYLDCYDTTGVPHMTAISWDTSGVDLTTAGLYCISGTPELPLHGTLGEEAQLPRFEIQLSVQDRSAPDLNAASVGNYSCRFLWLIPETELTELRISTQDGMLSAEELGITWNTQGLTIPFRALVPDLTYQLCAVFDDCETGVLTFSYDGSSFFWSYDPSLRDDALLPPAEEETPEEVPEIPPQPEAPPAPAEPAPLPERDTGSPKPSVPAIRPSTPKKEEEPAQREILGAELLTMVSEGPAQFSQDRMTLLFSRESIWDLDVKDEDVLSVLIKDEGEHSFSIAVTRNGEFLETFKDLQIQVPYETKAASPILHLTDEEGTIVAEGQYDSESGLAAFTLDRTGRYTIVEETAAEPPVTSATPPVKPPAKPSQTSPTPSAPSTAAPRPAATSPMLLPATCLTALVLLSFAVGAALRRQKEKTA